MKFLIKRGQPILFALLVTLFFLSTVILRSHAQQTQLPKPAAHLNDFAEAVEETTRQRLEKVLENLEQKTGVKLVVVTIKTADAKDLYDYSLQLANDWNVGAPASRDKSVLLLITSENGKFFIQASRPVRAYLPDGLIGEMALRLRPKLDAGSYNDGLLIAVQTFVNRIGEQNNFNFATLDTQEASSQLAQSRPRRVADESKPSESPSVEATPSPSATPAESPSPTAEVTPSETPAPSPTAPATPTPPLTPTETPTPAPAETPGSQPIATPSPEAAPSPTATISETPPPTPEAPATPASTPTQTPGAEASPTPAGEVADNKSSPPTKSSTANRKGATPVSNPEDEKEEVELTLTLPVDKRIDALKKFIVAHPNSVATPRASELMLAAHATLGDQKLKASDREGGLQEFRLAFSEAPPDLSDRAFIEIVAQIPLNLFLRGEREAAMDAARQAEALAKLNTRRVISLTQFYLTIEDANEANRLAELAVQTAPDSAVAHQVLGAARHIALRLDDAEKEYARAVELDAKLGPAKLSLADLKRAGGKFEEALSLYRDVLQGDAQNKSARAGLIVSLLELARKDEAEQELARALNDKDQSKNLALLTGAAYWFLAHNNPKRGLELAEKAVGVEPRYSWAQIALARALIADGRPLQAERSLRFARQYAQFPILDYELANMLAGVGLYEEAAQELARSFTLKGGQIETKLAGRNGTQAANFLELLAAERRAAIFQPAAADTEANAKMLKALLSLTTALNADSINEDDVAAKAQEFAAGDDPMRAYRAVYAAGKLLRKGLGLSTVIDLMDQARTTVEAALNVPAATVAVQPDELADVRARALAQGGTPSVPDAPRSALSALLRAKIEDLQGVAFFNLDKPNEAVERLRLAVSAAPDGTPLRITAMWHLASALEASGKPDQALLYYIKSYLAGGPDPARRSVIESVYKKVNGTLDGLDEKIGPAFTTATATPEAKPSASPAATPTPRP
jgi:predicted Zn-dependent protease